MCLYFVFCFVLRFTFHVLCSASCVLCFVFCVFLFSFLPEYFMRTTHRSKFFLVNETGIPPLIYGGEANMHPLASCLSTKGNEEDCGKSVNEPYPAHLVFFCWRKDNRMDAPVRVAFGVPRDVCTCCARDGSRIQTRHPTRYTHDTPWLPHHVFPPCGASGLKDANCAL